MRVGEIVYWARILPTHGIYDLIELKIRTVEDFYFVGTDKNTKQAYMFRTHAIYDTIFYERSQALEKIRFEESKIGRY